MVNDESLKRLMMTESLLVKLQEDEPDGEPEGEPEEEEEEADTESCIQEAINDGKTREEAVEMCGQRRSSSDERERGPLRRVGGRQLQGYEGRVPDYIQTLDDLSQEMDGASMYSTDNPELARAFSRASDLLSQAFQVLDGYYTSFMM